MAIELDTRPEVATWLKIGRANPWIARASDPAFSERSFWRCDTAEELRERFGYCNWCVGAAFTYEHLCFINQDEGGDEWLTIAHGIDFESISWDLVIAKGEFGALLARLLAATPEQCRTLDY